MAMDNLFGVFDVSTSGMRAEWSRMEVIANNLANAETTRTPEGGPYRKRHVVFSTMLDGMKGVKLDGTVESKLPPREVFKPGHPHADENGFVSMPNISRPKEMSNLMQASRAYQANMAAMRNLKTICEETLKLLR